MRSKSCESQHDFTEEIISCMMSLVKYTVQCKCSQKSWPIVM